MKITKLLLVMALAGSSLNQASAQNSSTMSAARHVGDGVRSVGDSNRYVEMSEDTRPRAFKPKASLVSNSQMLDMEMLAPSVSGDCGCGSGRCDTGCDSALISGCGNKSTEYWLNMESLLWFGQRRNSPPLITTANQGVLPVVGGQGVTTEVGGPDGTPTGLLTGYSLSGGRYLDACQKIAVGGRVFGIFQNSQTRTITSDGTTSVGIPFYNTTINAEDAYLVAFNTGVVPVSSGTVSARMDLNMIGAEASGYFLLGRSNDHRVDLVSGYTYNKLKDSTTVGSITTDQFTGNLIPDGTTFTTSDLFEAENNFHGAHIGMLSSVVHKRITLSTLAKVSFGSMNQTASVRGFTIQDFNGTASFPGGVLTQQSNIVEFSRNTFAFLPEMRVKMGYSLSECIQLNVGYSFMYWSSVALSGNQIDHSVDFSQALGGAASTRPAFSFVDSGYWMHGIDLGLSMTY
ncbi:MAG: BBP7 family outer membrane beta-barrel protein [Pirellulaceae bacterium]|nr:BBP7 family outer membrane beta-barrel protein [Pirellulaceae bacterium]